MVLLSVYGHAGAAALTLHHTYRFESSRLVLDGFDSTSLHAGRMPRTWEQGQPEIPFDVVTLLVPCGSRVTAIRVRGGRETVFSEGARLQPAQPMRNDDGKWAHPRPARLTATALDAVDPGGATKARTGSYPAILAEPAGGGMLHGYQLISLRVYPVHYEVASGRILVTDRLDLEVDLAPGGPLPLPRERFSPAIEAAAHRSLARLVGNPDAIESYDRHAGVVVEKGTRGFQPADAPSLEGSNVDYVIITGQGLVASLQALADWKTRRGVPTVVRSLDWVEANYRHGSDLQETIRTFIQDAYAKWGVQYVLLAGDSDVIPARYGYSEFGVESDRLIPSDLYFACLDGNWNMDGDALWGEAAISGFDPGDSTDMYAEVFVGRLTVSTAVEADAFINKLITYENPADTTYQERLLMLGEVLFPVDWSPGQEINTDGADYCEEFLTVAPACVAPTRLYENYTAFPGSSQLTRQATIDEMNAGYGLVNHIGHGFRYNMSLGDMSLVNTDAAQLTNGDRRFVLYFVNCTATAFDFPCLAEEFLDTSGGAVAVLGSSRAAFSQPASNYNREFFQALYQQGYSHVGQVFVQSRLQYTPMTWFDTTDHYSHLLYNLLGDPEMVVHTCRLGTTQVTHPSSIGLGLTNITVGVAVDASPRQGALVCLQKGTEEYEFGTTDATGSVTLPFQAETSGIVQVTVSGQNMTTYLDSIAVQVQGSAYVHIQSLLLDDDTTGGSNGNSDGVLDAGETLELDVTFVNDGGAAANAVTGVLRIPSPWASVVDSAYTLGTLAASGGMAQSDRQVSFTVLPDAPDGVVLQLTFESSDSVSVWTDAINRVVHAPDMQLTILDIQDDPPGGNGDGSIQAGETFDLLAYFKNFGTGAADGVQASLSSIDPDVQITNGSVSIGRVNPIEELTGPTALRLRESILTENQMWLSLTDSHSRSVGWVITLRGPAKPATPVLDVSGGVNVVAASWTPSTDADLAGYHVYRSSSSSGPWTRTTVDATAGVAYFRDTGLAPNTRYYYSVTAVDQSGNESAPSDVANINTNPAQLSGWPINLGAVSSCPAAVGDITGDGSKEIVAGNDFLYAWRWDGIELLDDDGDPQTWGVFSSEIPTITAAIVLAELDSTPGLEVFATVWDDSNKAFIVRGDGSFPSGWPQSPNPTSGTTGYWGSPGAMDVDGDGFAEVFAPSKNGNLYAWHADGTPLGASAAFKSALGSWSRCSPSFANLDGDPEVEIVYGAPNGQLHIWNPDGSNFGSFPKSPGILCLSNTAIGDVDNDGVVDVVMITEGGAVNIFDTATGTQLAGWPVSLSVKGSPISPSPALADFDFDGFLEVVVANRANPVSQSAVRIYDHQGNVLPGWPMLVDAEGSESSPIVADFSGDGVPDILFGNEGGLLYGWDKDGVELPGFPISIGDFVRSTAFADDVDDDGDIDLVFAGWDQNVYIWDFTVPYVAAAAQWPTLKHDAQRSANYYFRNTIPAAIDDLGAAASGGGLDGTTAITLTWSAVQPGATVEVYRKGFGDYPEFDDGAGSMPSEPADPGAAIAEGWTLTSVTASGQADVPAARDFWFYVAFVTDAFGKVSLVSNMTSGTLDYYLGDVHDGTTNCQGDNLVGNEDISYLGATYGTTIADGDPAGCLDVGPTSDATVNGRPLTDNQIQFEDLVVFALNYGQSSKQVEIPVPAAADELVVEGPERVEQGERLAVDLWARGTGRVRAFSARLIWNPEVVEPIRVVAGELLERQGGVALSPKPGAVDVAVLGTGRPGLSGDGVAASVVFRAVGSGDPRVDIEAVDARDVSNQPVEMRTGSRRTVPLPQVTALYQNIPNPFNPMTTIRFELARAGHATLRIYDISGRLVRQLVDDELARGAHPVVWDGLDHAGRPVASGLYFYQLVTGEFTATRKMVVVK